MRSQLREAKGTIRGRKVEAEKKEKEGKKGKERERKKEERRYRWWFLQRPEGTWCTFLLRFYACQPVTLADSRNCRYFIAGTVGSDTWPDIYEFVL